MLVTDGCPHWRPAESDRRRSASEQKRERTARQLRALEERQLMRITRGQRRLLPIVRVETQRDRDRRAVADFAAWLARVSRRSVE